MIHSTPDQLTNRCRGIIDIKDRDIAVIDETRLRDELIDELVRTAVFSNDEETRNAARWIIRRTAAALGIFEASIQPLYDAMGRGDVTGFSVPAINIRGMTYYTAQAVFRAALAGNVGPVIFEIARSEITYTSQRPAEYGASIAAAAIKTGYRGPLFLQGDHFQINAKKYAAAGEAEVAAVKDLIREAVAAGFYNIDIDASTIVDLSQPTVAQQQHGNFAVTADLTAFIRSIEPAEITVSTGGEIGEVGTKNTTIEEFEVFMENYLETLRAKGSDLTGISKISIQTGTTHGGVPLPDGSIAQVKIDFDTIRNISKVARERFGIAGSVQHGASTLPDEAFDRFPAEDTAEVHLATGFQNIIYDSTHFPGDLKEKIYAHLRETCAGERKETDTEEQFIYKTRKKGFGAFKQEFWDMPATTLTAIGAELEKQFAFLFGKLNVTGTKQIVDTYVLPVDAAPKRPASLS